MKEKLWKVYGFLSLIAFIPMLGTVYRKEDSLNVITAMQNTFPSGGILGILWELFRYFLFYSAFIVFPFIFLNKFMKKIENLRSRSEWYSLVIIIWVLMIAKPLDNLIGYLGSLWGGWYLIVFLVFTYFVFNILIESLIEINNNEEEFKVLKGIVDKRGFFILLAVFILFWISLHYRIGPGQPDQF